jgi:antitoxin (DNA-binding transcriptional repressor) of toxin-antitoxin stability system
MTEPQKLPVETARKQFAELLNGSQFRGEHTQITRHNHVAGVLVPADWYDRAVKALADGGQTGDDDSDIATPTPAAHKTAPAPVASYASVARLTDKQAAELAARAFATADPTQFATLTEAANNGDRAVIEAALAVGALNDTDVLAA